MNSSNISELNQTKLQLSNFSPIKLRPNLAEISTTKPVSTTSSNFKEPNTYKQAINSDYKEQWTSSMQTELDSLNSNNTWDLVPLLIGIKPLKTRWVYKVKNPNNSPNIEDVSFKSRFVAKGFEQLYELDYIDTFTSVIKQIA